MNDEIEDLSNTADIVGDLASLRKAEGLSQEHVARSMGVSGFTVSRIEKLQSDPTISQLQRYARAVGTRIILKADT